MAVTYVNPRKALFASLYVDAMFVDGVPCTPNATEIAVKAGYSKKSAHSQAPALLADPLVQEAVNLRLQMHVAKTGITTQDIFNHFADIALADPNDVVAVRTLCCRYCHGVGHAYQWEPDEYAQAAMEQYSIDPQAPPLTCEGGTDWNHTLPPHPECPKCRGDGTRDVHLADTRKLSPRARKLYAGAKYTKYGIEVQLHSQMEAWQTLAKMSGAFVERREHSGPGGGPIKTASVNVTLPVDAQDAAKIYAALMEGKAPT